MTRRERVALTVAYAVALGAWAGLAELTRWIIH